MNTPTKVAGFALGLAAVFAITLGIGNAVGGVAEDPPQARRGTRAAATRAPRRPRSHGHPGRTDGFAGRLHACSSPRQQAQPGADVAVAFTITGPDGQPVTAYDVEHEKQLHLIAVRRDFTGFQHVHPVLGDDGTWTTELDLTSGQWRVFADFKATGADALTLGADLAVSGDYAPATLPHRVADRRGRRLHGHPRGRPRGGCGRRAHAVGLPRRRTGHRPGALPRRLRPPRRAARGRPRLPARPPRRGARRRPHRARARRGVLRRRAQPRRLPPLPGLQARGSGPDCGVRAGDPRHGEHRLGAPP